MEVKDFSEKFKEIKLIHGLNFEDERGSLKKTMFGDELQNLISPIKEVLCSTSKKSVIRGLHFQNPPFAVKKLITCVKGTVMDVFLDLRSESDTYGEFESIKLKEDDSLALLIPEGFAHGYSTLSNEAILIYLQSGNYNYKYDESINPLSLGIDWQVDNPIISKKDKASENFKRFKSKF